VIRTPPSSAPATANGSTWCAGQSTPLLGLDDQWAYNAIKQVGNYSDIFQRNLGQGSPWKFPRGINALWRNGGVLYPLPLR